MSSPFASNIPISVPKNNPQFTSEVDLGGFSWDSRYGIFIPNYQEINNMEPPQPPLKNFPKG